MADRICSANQLMASFPRLVSLFYATFDSNKGAKILVQAPDDAINNSSTSLFDFNSISEFIIPKKQLCNRLITITTPSAHRIVGFPVHIPGPQYERYLFIYNLAFVFDERGEIGSYIPVVRRLAMTFKQLEACPNDSR
jgi:nitrogen permease regulator 2-like protein